MNKNGFIKGFTLIEILIVLVIVSLLAVLVMLRSGFVGSEDAKAVSDRLRSILVYAEQQAVLQPATIGFDYDPKNPQKGYRFLIYKINAADKAENKKETWQPITSDSVLRAYPLPVKIKLVITSNNTHPAIIFFPTGEITNFKINITESNNKKKSLYQITGASNGAIALIKTP